MGLVALAMQKVHRPFVSSRQFYVRERRRNGLERAIRSASGAKRTNRAGLMTSVVQGKPDVAFPGLDSSVQKSSSSFRFSLFFYFAFR
jgi:hypothetical protein